jgi:hypothetical protein
MTARVIPIRAILTSDRIALDELAIALDHAERMAGIGHLLEAGEWLQRARFRAGELEDPRLRLDAHKRVTAAATACSERQREWRRVRG